MSEDTGNPSFTDSSVQGRKFVYEDESYTALYDSRRLSITQPPAYGS